MPIIAASEVDQSGTSITAATTPTSEALTPRPTSATRIGSPAATTEPKTSSRMIAAAAMPMPSEPMSPWVAVSTTCPPTATWTPGRSAASARSMIRWVSSTGIASGFGASSWTVACTVRPSGEIVPCCPYGLGAATTCGTVAIRPSRPSTVARTAGSVTRPSARTTTSTCSPAAAGNRSANRSCAARESEPRAV